MRLFKWIGNALSENGAPSSKRLFGFLFVVTICYAIGYKVHISHDLPKYIYYGALGMIALLAGVATVPQIRLRARATLGTVIASWRETRGMIAL